MARNARISAFRLMTGSAALLCLPHSLAAATNSSLADKVEIRITSAKLVPITPKIYGINCAEMFIADLVQKPEHLSALRELQ